MEFVETEEQCKTMIEEAINHGFLKIYVEAMIVQPSAGENHINGVGNMAVNADDLSSMKKLHVMAVMRTACLQINLIHQMMSMSQQGRI